MRIVGIEKDDIKKVIKESSYGFDYVELQNGAKVIINHNPMYLGEVHNHKDGSPDLNSYGSVCVFNYPSLEKELTNDQGEIEFDDKKMLGYIARLYINGKGYNIYGGTPQGWAFLKIFAMHGGMREHRGLILDEINRETYFQIPLVAFQNHPKLIGDIQKIFDKKLLSLHEYVKDSSSEYSEEESKWLEEALISTEKNFKERLSIPEKALSKNSTK